MYQNPTLTQHLADAKLAELRRATVDRELRMSDVRHDFPLRSARPLLAWRRNH